MSQTDESLLRLFLIGATAGAILTFIVARHIIIAYKRSLSKRLAQKTQELINHLSEGKKLDIAIQDELDDLVE